MANISCSAKATKYFRCANTQRNMTDSHTVARDDAVALNNKTKNEMQRKQTKRNTNQQNKRVERVTRLIKTWNATIPNNENELIPFGGQRTRYHTKGPCHIPRCSSWISDKKGISFIKINMPGIKQTIISSVLAVPSVNSVRFCNLQTTNNENARNEFSLCDRDFETSILSCRCKYAVKLL